jgi:hypothetical protein
MLVYAVNTYVWIASIIRSIGTRSGESEEGAGDGNCFVA